MNIQWICNILVPRINQMSQESGYFIMQPLDYIEYSMKRQTVFWNNLYDITVIRILEKQA